MKSELTQNPTSTPEAPEVAVKRSAEPRLSSTRPTRAFFGLLTQRARWGLSRRGWLVMVAAAMGLGYGGVRAAHPFLAVTHRVPTDVLVVEGWIDLAAIDAAAAEFTTGSYHHVFTTGGPVHGSGPYSNDYNTSASVGAGRLKSAGVPADCVQMVPSRVRERDRTYGAALALRRWCDEHQLQIHSLNVVTEDVHARRSRLLFEKALGSTVKVGIVSVPNTEYDSRHWWLYSEGVKEMISEGAAYLYVRFFFHP